MEVNFNSLPQTRVFSVHLHCFKFDGILSIKRIGFLFTCLGHYMEPQKADKKNNSGIIIMLLMTILKE